MTREVTKTSYMTSVYDSRGYYECRYYDLVSKTITVAKEIFNTDTFETIVIDRYTKCLFK